MLEAIYAGVAPVHCCGRNHSRFFQQGSRKDALRIRMFSSFASLHAICAMQHASAKHGIT